MRYVTNDLNGPRSLVASLAVSSSLVETNETLPSRSFDSQMRRIDSYCMQPRFSFCIFHPIDPKYAETFSHGEMHSGHYYNTDLQSGVSYYLAPLVKVAWWKKLLFTNSHHTENLNFPAKELRVRLLFWFL